MIIRTTKWLPGALLCACASMGCRAIEFSDLTGKTNVADDLSR
jgi:hypothetical protein